MRSLEETLVTVDIIEIEMYLDDLMSLIRIRLSQYG